MEKLNIAELLRDCPTGMELDSTLFEGLEFDCIVDNEYLPIRCRIKHPNGGYTVYNFTKYGCWLDTTFAKCVIFPKGKTTWEGFVPPCKFKDGDILIDQSGEPFIFKKLNNDKGCYSYCGINSVGKFMLESDNWTAASSLKFANEKEKQKLFQAIKGNGCKWNPETKTLEKLPEFKAGDVLVSTAGNIVLCSRIDDNQVVHFHCRLSSLGEFEIKNDVGVGKSFHCTLASDIEKQRLFDKLKSAGYKYNPQTNKLEKLIVPKFKVGDRIKYRGGEIVYRVVHITDDSYVLDNLSSIPISIEHMYDLVPNKFDITTLKAFDRVLTRVTTGDVWGNDFFGYYKDGWFHCSGHIAVHYCIPYENNQHLLGTTNDCDDYYKTWE